MVLGVGAEGTVGALLKTADAVAQASHAGESPFAGELLFVAAEGTIVGVVLLGQTRFDFGHVLHAGDAEQLAAVAEISVGEQDDGGHVLEGDLGGVEGPVEAVGAAGGGDNHEGSLAVAAVEGLVEVALLGLGGQTRGGAAALHVDDDERELGHHGETQSLALQRQTGAGGAGAGQGTGIAGADGGADTGDLVFSLEHAGAEALVFGEFDHHVGGGGDGVGAEEQTTAALLGGGKQTPGGGHVAGDVAIATLLHLVGLSHLEDVRMNHLELVGIFITLGQDGFVELDDGGFLGELALQIGEGVVEGLMGGIEDDAEGKHVAALVGGLLVDALFLADALGEAGDGGLDDGVGALQLVGEGVLRVAGLLDGFIGEGVDVDDDGGTLLGPFQLRLEGSGVHGDEDVAFVTGAVDMVTHMHLIAADAGHGVVRGTDFGRIVGESGNVVAGESRCIREQCARKLHAVTRIASKSDHEVIFINNLILCHVVININLLSNDFYGCKCTK